METKVKNHGETLKNFLISHRIPQKELCKALNISAQNFDPTLMREKINQKHLNRIKEVYGIDLDNYNESDANTLPLVLREHGLVQERATHYENGDNHSGPTCKQLLEETQRHLQRAESEIESLKKLVTYLEKHQKES